ncbi:MULTISPECIES: metallophosphoesterase [Carboxydocella]|uniref:Phosphoesterase n=2 Tax=Carboxydocella TaxID=178898 RepID=A0A1T4LDW1_9FIRM|nr:MULTISPECIES: metallophosphoesterase [Carboxydocella]AVX19830.1 hypothetical protein CFE_0631 [Carboxydocella thermautotrophica]AVX30239.1 hypothetical protein CTH_0636 [Carboxydocella thermautotrophica]SJZ52925.1 hypothetical protein SAMN02745885_00163 [Carboxydocella sporoproducens DSM 16521]GAW28653.1 hypothetical protein ULO1_12230 [Carboxydocella sp. ULO1]GAW31726.1 hypothetical protein JDF658_14910 [Carboxydocella sp. JDF658]
MKILVFSDTHGRWQLCREVLDREGRADAILHAGDHYDDAIALSQVIEVPVYGVKGNCDWAGPEEKKLVLADVPLLLLHGHRYGAKSGLSSLYYKGQEEGVRIVVFGHSHIPVQEDDGQVLLFNPGSLARPRTGSPYGSYGRLWLEQDGIRVEIVEWRP